MKTTDLAAILQNADKALEINQQAVTPPFLDATDAFVRSIQESPAVLDTIAALTRIDKFEVIRILPYLRQAVEAERKVISGQGEQIRGIIQRLLGWKWVLAGLARLL